MAGQVVRWVGGAVLAKSPPSTPGRGLLRNRGTNVRYYLHEMKF